MCVRSALAPLRKAAKHGRGVCVGNEFGWFAYAGSAHDGSPRLFVMTARREFALVLAGVGLLILGTLLGFAVGRRAGPTAWTDELTAADECDA